MVVHYEGCTGNSAKAALMDINRDKFRVKWRRELRRQPEFNPKNPVIERQQSRRVLFSDYYLPMPDRDAGSARMYWLMQLAIQAGHEVAFLALDGRGQEQYQQRLRAAGITLTVGEGRAPREILAALPGKVPEVAYISHYYTGAALAPVIRELWPDCRVVIDSVDLHYLRLARQADVTGSASLRDEACRTRVEELAALAHRSGSGNNPLDHGAGPGGSSPDDSSSQPGIAFFGADGVGFCREFFTPSQCGRRSVSSPGDLATDKGSAALPALSGG